MASKPDTTRERLTKLEDAVASLQQLTGTEDIPKGVNIRTVAQKMDDLVNNYGEKMRAVDDLRADVARNESRIDDLASAIKNLLDGIDGKFNEEIAPLARSLADFHDRAKTLEQRHLRFNDEARIVTLEKRLGELKRTRHDDFVKHGHRISTLSGTVGALEKRLNRIEGERDED